MDQIFSPSKIRPSIPESIVIETLWKQSSDDHEVWALLDGQWIKDLAVRLIESKLEFCSLFEGPITQERLSASPYLVKLSSENSFTRWLFTQGWGHGWGVFFQASPSHVATIFPNTTTEHIAQKRSKGEFFGSEDIEHSPAANTTLMLRKHFRRYTRVNLENEDRIVAFRFFDPAILNVWLRSMNDDELGAFMRPIRFFLYEDYCDVATLNRPDRLYVFSHQTSPQRRYSARQYDYETDQIRNMPRFSPSETGTLSFGANGMMLLRQSVRKQFEQRQLGMFKEEVLRDIEKARSTYGLVTDEVEMRALVERQIESGYTMGLRSRRNLANYVLCSLRYGDDFAVSIPQFKKLFSKQRPERDIEPLLRDFASGNRTAYRNIA